MTTSKTERFIVNLIVFFYKIPSYVYSIFIGIMLFIPVWSLATVYFVALINFFLFIASFFMNIEPTLNKWFIVTCAVLGFFLSLYTILAEKLDINYK